MPDALTHRLFGLNSIEVIPNAFKEVILSEPSLFEIGTSGPDPFYYYGMIPWLPRFEKKLVQSIGTKLHTHRINDFFLMGMEYYKRADDSFKSYFLGYMAHYSLDRTCHPFIFYQSGFSDDLQDRKKYNAMHKRYEVIIDAKLANHFLDRSTLSKDLYDFLNVNQTKLASTVDFYQKTIHHLYDVQLTKKEIYAAFKDMNSSFNLLMDETGKKRALFKKIESNAYPILSASTYNEVLDGKYDVLNLNHQEWKQPVTKQVSSKDFYELMDDALEDLKQLYEAFLYYLETKDYTRMLAFVDERLFDTGLKIDAGHMLVHDSIFER